LVCFLPRNKVSPVGKLWASGSLENSRGAEKGVKLDSVLRECMLHVGYMSNLKYVIYTIYLVYGKHDV
ncbi:MAG: hypothetical protein M3R15_25430, partial [Acidobacteriota bacterium]|nr:hypothetical protein [Acidobacteriota bacterium]